jgi:hypothetical protein
MDRVALADNRSSLGKEEVSSSREKLLARHRA